MHGARNPFYHSYGKVHDVVYEQILSTLKAKHLVLLFSDIDVLDERSFKSVMNVVQEICQFYISASEGCQKLKILATGRSQVQLLKFQRKFSQVNTIHTT